MLSKASDVRLARSLEPRSLEQSHLLLIDLPDTVIELCTRAFQKAHVEVAVGLSDVSSEIWSKAPDLVLIDVFGGSNSGLGTVAELGTSRAAPFIVVSEATDPIDRAVAIELGATDYIGVPFFDREFVARVRRALVWIHEHAVGIPRGGGVFLVDQLCVDMDRRKAYTARGDIDFTPAEFELLKTFVRLPQQVISREKLAKHSLSENSEVSVRAVDVLVARLRKKLAQAACGELITTVRNGGYMLSKAVKRS